MKRKTLMSWSSGKDSALALHKLLQKPEYEVVGLFTTINREVDRVTMHGVRVELLKAQAESIGLPIEIIELPDPCTNDEYENIMERFLEKIKANNIECMAFGDLYLEDIRKYREAQLKDTGIQAIFPIWGSPTDELSNTLIEDGFKTVISCVDSKQIPEAFAGKNYDHSFLDSLPETADPCGENGEFHSFVYDCPMFKKAIKITVGETIYKGQFVFVDLLPVT